MIVLVVAGTLVLRTAEEMVHEANPTAQPRPKCLGELCQT